MQEVEQLLLVCSSSALPVVERPKEPEDLKRGIKLGSNGFFVGILAVITAIELLLTALCWLF
jgi:hypothetical protein